MLSRSNPPPEPRWINNSAFTVEEEEDDGIVDEKDKVRSTERPRPGTAKSMLCIIVLVVLSVMALLLHLHRTRTTHSRLEEEAARPPQGDDDLVATVPNEVSGRVAKLFVKEFAQHLSRMTSLKET
jgi:hypothetical protein